MTEQNYKETIFLPSTSFPMRAKLNDLEAKLLEFWKSIDLYKQMCAKGKGQKKFILHDGPPYANGHLHMGHALNKILKDIVMKYQRMKGQDVPFVPGWDCHGLPIEWKIEEKYRAEKKDKDQVPILEFRQECREFAQKWVNIQSKEFEKLGVLADWSHPYLTMDFSAEAQIMEELYKVLMNGTVYKGLKPVQWSVVEKTALAEAEVEYQDKVSPSIYAMFPINSLDPKFKEVQAVIWTTTPWSLPANRAIAYNPDLSYVILQAHGLPAILVAEVLKQKVIEAASLQDVKVLETLPGTELEGLMAFHPLKGAGYDFEVPFLPGAHVTIDQGTGLVHTAPSHGVDDFQLGLVYGLEIPELIGEEGVFHPQVPLFAGLHIFKANEPIIKALQEKGALLAETKITHSYPHSWRSKSPLIYRATSQWFFSMEKNNLRQKALQAIKDTKWVPVQGEKRLASMIESRPDWCLSRQRAWGVPIALFVSKKTGKPLVDREVNDRIIKAIYSQGSDVWYTKDPQEFLGSQYNADDFEQVKDILDVWFESGTTHAFVLEKNPTLNSPADLYLEGSDQHRGWFNSSLLESCATRGHAPFKTVVTHGFIVDEQGRKMSKSVGNTVDLAETIEKHGVDVLRLWVVGSDYFDDSRIGPDIIKRQEDIYRKLRNTLRYLLGNLGEFKEAQRVAYEQLPELERWVLHRLTILDKAIQEKIQTYSFYELFSSLYNFCILELSAFYFDIRKDTLYCDARESSKTNAVLTVLDILFGALCKWLAPIISFTAEEAWQTRFPGQTIHLQNLPEIPLEWHDLVLDSKWQILRDIRRVVTGALELERAQGRIGSSLQAHIRIYLQDRDLAPLLSGINIEELMIISSGEVIFGNVPSDAFVLEEVKNVGVRVELASGEKCNRCWRVLSEVGEDLTHPTLCSRCIKAVE